MQFLALFAMLLWTILLARWISRLEKEIDLIRRSVVDSRPDYLWKDRP